MIKRILLLLAVIVVAILVVSPAMALSTIANAVYTGTIQIDNAGGATTNVSTVMTLDTQVLIDGDYIDADCLNTAVRINSVTDAAYMPAPGDDDNWCLFVPTASTAQQEYHFYAGGTAMAGKLRYFPGATGMTASDDNADFELGNIFSIEQKGFINTASGSNKNLILKTGAIQTYVSSADTITALFYKTSTTEQLAPSGAGSETNWSAYGAGSNWQACLTDDGDTSYVSTADANYVRDMYATTNSSIGAGIIISVRVSIVAKGGGSFAYGGTSLRTHSTTYDGGGTLLATSYTTYSTTYTLNPQTNAAWTWAEVNDMEIGVQGKGWAGIDNAFCTQVYAVVTYNPAHTVTLTPVPSSEYTLKTYSDGSYFMLSLNGNTSWDGIHSARIATGGASVINNSNNWSFLENDSMPYMEYQKITIGATLSQNITWEYNTAAPYVFTDAALDNDCVPTFRTASSDGDVSATLKTFIPVDEAVAPAGLSNPGAGIITTAPTEPSDLYTEDEDTSGFFIVPIFTKALDSASIPRAAFFYPVTIIICIATAFLVYKKTTSYVIACIVMTLCWAAAWQAKVVAGWVLIFLVVAILAVGITEWAHSGRSIG